MARQTYSSKLKDPRWQKKRLEILHRDSFACQCCGETKKTLHVHHTNSNYEIEPWEHEEFTLVTLCEDCHKCWHSIFDLPFDPEQISLVVKLFDRSMEMQIEHHFDNNNE